MQQFRYAQAQNMGPMVRRLGLLTFVIILLSGWMALANDPSRLSLSQYVNHRWDARDGLPQNSAHKITQTENGFIWVGTQEGLARFDGFDFVVYNQVNTPLMISHEVTCLVPDREGGLWIGMQKGGLLYWGDGRFSRPLESEILNNATVLSIFQEKSGAIYLGTATQGLLFINEGKMERFAGPFGVGGITALGKWPGKGIVLGSQGGGLLLFQDRVFQQISLASDDLALFINDMAPAPGGGLLVATDGAGLFLVNDLEITLLVHMPDVPRLNHINSVSASQTGEIWWGSDQGISRMVAGQVDHFPVDDRGNAQIVYQVAHDNQGNLWVGLAGLGLQRFSLGSITPMTHSEGLCDDIVWMVTTDPMGDILVGTDNAGLCRVVKGKATSDGIPDNLGKSVINSAAYDSKGQLWVGTLDGLFRTAEGRVEKVGEGHAAYSGWVFPVYCDTSDRIWFGSDAGFFMLDDEQLTPLTDEALDPESFQSIVEDGEGRLWIGGSEGLICIADGEVRVFRQEGSLLDSQQITALLVDGKGLWVSHYTNGLGWFEAGEFQFFEDSGLLPDIPYALLDDDADHLWYSSNAGVVRVPKEALRDWLRGDRTKIQWRKFGTPDGMPSAECNLGGIPAATKDPAGRLWFSTVEGLAMVDPARLQPDPPPPKVYISDIMVDGKALPIGSEIALPARFKAVDIYFGAIEYFDPRSVTFQTQLSSLSSSPRINEKTRVAHFTQLPSGLATFSVSAGNDRRGYERSQLILHIPKTPLEIWHLRLVLGILLFTFLALGLLVWKWWVSKRNYSEFQDRLGYLKRRQSEKRTLLDSTTGRLAVAHEGVEQVELAAHLLHSVGNVLNSISVSSGMLEKMLRHSGVPDLLRKIGGIFHHQGKDASEHSQKNQTGAKLPSALSEIAEILEDGQADLFGEMANLQLQCGHVEDIVKGLGTSGEGMVVCKLHLLVEDALKLQGHLIKKHQIQLDCGLGGRAEVVCRRSQLVQILVNIIRNGMEAMVLAKTDQPPIMTFRLQDQGEGKIALDIGDNGIGINQEDIDRLFSRGYTTKKSGYGFGLSFCKAMMMEMQGDIEVMSDGWNKGATFRLTMMGLIS